MPTARATRYVNNTLRIMQQVPCFKKEGIAGHPRPLELRAITRALGSVKPQRRRGTSGEPIANIEQATICGRGDVRAVIHDGVGA